MPTYQISPAGRAPAITGLHHVPVILRSARATLRGKVGWYLRLHLFCLICYALLGKGFAYVGTGYFYISEVLLILGLIALIASRHVLLLFRSPIGIAMMPFLLWECICSIPYTYDYGMNVARDAVVWGYAAFGWIIAALVLSSYNSSHNMIDLVVARYRRFVPWYLILGPLAMVVGVFFSTRLPAWPGSGVPIVSVKFDEFEAHMAGIAAFLIVGLSPAGWRLALVGVGVLVGSPNRGGLAGFFVAFLLATIFARRLRALLLPAVMLALLLLAAALDIHVSIPGAERDYSTRQLLDDFGSTVSTDVDTADLQNTREWRLEWWQKIWDYTVNGPYFWTGKGYGINLAVDDGFQDAEQLLRSPHNSHLTFLARSGVPGFCLWIALQVTWLSTMLTSFLRAKQSGKARWGALFAWLICYWAAFMTAAGFDVFLENPMAAIPFWTIFGLGWGSHITFTRFRVAELKSFATR